MAASDLTCEVCGARFTLPESVRERYPDWTPSRCRDCHRRGGDHGRETTTGPPGRRPRGGKGRGKTLTEENLTTAQVLDRYEDGPTTGVFTDGSAVPNPGPGGWGAVYVVDDEVVDEAHGDEPATTNNRMELRAVIEGIDLVPDGTAATVYTDSRLVHDTLTSWAAGWKRRGWKRKTGEVQNLDLVKEAFARVEARPEISLEWVPAHSGYRWNEYADSLSTAFLRDEV